MTDERLASLLEQAGPRIAHLALARAAITDRSAELLARLPRLVWLDLRNTSIGDAGVEKLAKAKTLRHLNLVGTKVTDQALGQLAQHDGLQALFLWQSKVTATGVKQLRHQRPGLAIRHAPTFSRGSPKSQRPQPSPRRTQASEEAQPETGAARRRSEGQAQEEAPRSGSLRRSQKRPGSAPESSVIEPRTASRGRVRSECRPVSATTSPGRLHGSKLLPPGGTDGAIVISSPLEVVRPIRFERLVAGSTWIHCAANRPPESAALKGMLTR